MTSMKLTNVHRDYHPLKGNVYFCNLNGKLMLASEARKIILSRLAELDNHYA